MDQILYYIALPFGYLMKFCVFISPGRNYLLALVFFTVIIQVLLCLAFGIKQQKNMQKQAMLAPKAAAIRKKYAGREDNVTKQKMQEEIMALYQANGYSPMGGCLPMLIQLPIIMALYYVIVYPLQYICMLGSDAVHSLILAFKDGGFLSANALKTMGENFDATSSLNGTRAAQVEIINKIHEWVSAGNTDSLNEYVYSVTDKINVDTLPNYKLFGLDFSVAPPYPSADNFSTYWPLIFVPVLILAVMILSTMITRKFSYQDPATKEQQNSCSMKAMMYSMPLLSVWVSFSLPAAVGVYWIYRSIAATLQQMILSKLMPMPVFTEEDYRNAERELRGKGPKKKKSASSGQSTGGSGEKKRSLHHIDDEDEGSEAALTTKLNGQPVDPESGEAVSEEDGGEQKEEKKKSGKNRDAQDFSGDAPTMKSDKNTKYEKK